MLFRSIKGYSVQYARVPVVESHSPSIDSLSEMVSILLENSSHKNMVFSDMTGHNKCVFCAAVAILIRVGDPNRTHV